MTKRCIVTPGGQCGGPAAVAALLGGVLEPGPGGAAAGAGHLAPPRLLPPQGSLPPLVHGAPPQQRGRHSLLYCQTIEYCLVNTRHIVIPKYI